MITPSGDSSGAIGTRTYEEREVILTALIHYQGGSQAGPGFSDLVESLRKSNGETNWRVPLQQRDAVWPKARSAVRRSDADREHTFSERWLVRGLDSPGVTATRSRGTAAVLEPPAIVSAMSADNGSTTRIGLVGCVKSKRPGAVPARDLYISALFRGRQRHVEATCGRWFILSALHGLVTPDEVIAPYDETLTRASRDRRREWSQEVLDALEARLGDLRGLVFEVHAGAPYRGHGLVAGLEQRGATVEIPAAGLRVGEQLAYYARRGTYGGSSG